VFDLAYYVVRVVAYQIPFIGGRAQGQHKPRAPTLTERPSGRRRAFSLRGEAAADEAIHLQKEVARRLVQIDNEKN
jgi:hypothetical protein